MPTNSVTYGYQRTTKSHSHNDRKEKNMALNPTASTENHNWNYSNPDGEGYSTSLTGTVVAVQEVQAMNFGANGKPSTPKFWDDGNPVMNIRLVLAGPSGGIRTWTITPASKAAKEGKKKSVHIDLFNLTSSNPAERDMMKLIGKTIEISTVAPPAGYGYGKGNPRPWEVKEVEAGPFEPKEPLPPIYLMPKVLSNQAVSGGVVTGGTDVVNATDTPF